MYILMDFVPNIFWTFGLVIGLVFNLILKEKKDFFEWIFHEF